MEWDFGDGSTSTDQSPTHRYTIAGRHTVGLEVSGPGGTDTRVMPGLVTVSPGPPVSLEVSPSSAAIAVQRSTQFTAVARDEFGNFVPSEVTWAIAGEGGSISSDGRFTADT
ncbi:MAG: PKD domain-containing protein, partial [Chloroflexi bacterium]|nr:PKD domain-containing protein [Chloroflexota bacterium]